MTESEREQMQRLITLQKVVLVIVTRWVWLFALVFVVLFAILGAYLTFRGAKSVGRFTATTRLLYNPRKVADIETLNDKQIISILDRASLKRQIADIVQMPQAEKECLAFDLTIKQEKKPTNLFTITAASQSWKGAVKKANAYAETLINGYASYRAKDLEAWGLSLKDRKNKLLAELVEIEAGESKLKAKTGIMSPQDALLALNTLISDQRKNASALGVDLTNEELKKKRRAGDSQTVGDDSRHRKRTCVAAREIHGHQSKGHGQASGARAVHGGNAGVSQVEGCGEPQHRGP